MTSIDDYFKLPADLPAPEDDGAAAHLAGAKMPDIVLTATDGAAISLARLAGRTVVYIYPRTGVPGVDNPDGWDAIPGARGCTPQSCEFRDHQAELAAHGARRLFGLSTQDRDYQCELRDRLHLPFQLLSDAQFKLGDAMKLPEFEVAGMRLYKRMALIIDDGWIAKVFYPVFPPDRNAADVLDWLKANPPLPQGKQ